MDYQGFVDMCLSPCAILSVEKVGESYGDIRIAYFNKLYKEIMGPTCEAGMLYYDLVPKDLKFEDFCYRSAVLGQRLHAYVETKAMDCWTDQQLSPVVSDDENIGYCQFMFSFTKQADPSLLASVSADTATSVVKTVVTLRSGQDFHTSLDEALDDVLERTGAVTGRIMLLDHEKKSAINFCEYISEEVGRFRMRGNGEITYDVANTWKDMIGTSNAVIVKNERDMEDLSRRNPTWAADMNTYGVASLLLIPLPISLPEFSGYLYAIDFDVSRVVEIKELMELSAFVLGSEISNHLLLEKLEALGNMDALTGLFNRHAMLQLMSEWQMNHQGEPFGIVNVDVNGLKAANDNEGHEAGDQLLIRSANALVDVAGHEHVYRTGGDEFVIISVGKNCDCFEDDVHTLREISKKREDISFAVGAFWSDGQTDMVTSFSKADERMYEDKRSYYAEHPEYIRR